MNLLYNQEFLQKIDKDRNKILYAKVTALNFNEFPIESIEGRLTGGSINIDGASAVRRSCSLTMVAQDFDYNDYYWGMNTKFKLEIGLQNNVDPTMPDIIWFNQGIFLISNFNTSRQTANFTISISGKDKMCLLNGELGGTLESSIDFGQIEEEDSQGNWTIKKIPIKDIIKNIVHVYAGEPYHNIVINDLDTFGLELLDYRYDVPMYLYRKMDSSEKIYDNAMIENNDIDLYLEPNNTEPSNIKKLSDLSNDYLESLTTTLEDGHDPKPVYIKNNNTYTGYYFTKVGPGETAGYRETDLVYAGDLIAKIGETITSVLDKIKNMLVEFEYFYNLDGQFVFQKKQSFISTMWSPNNSSDQHAQLPEALAMASSYSYTFSGGELISAFNNNPQINNVKNDYSIWGEKESISGAKIPIHFRYAIDVKPIEYNSIKVTQAEVDEYNAKYNTTLKPQIFSTKYVSGEKYNAQDTIITCDWREVIYQMACDYYKYNWLEDFELRIIRQNPTLYPTGRTGYENYYIDLQGFWRELYYPVLGSEYSEEKTKLDSYKTSVDKLERRIIGEIDENFEIYKWGIEYDLSILSEYLSKEKDDEAKDLIIYWNNRNDARNKKNNGQLKDTIATYGDNDFGFSTLDKDGNAYEDGIERKYYFMDDSKTPKPIESPNIYLSMLQDEYFREKSNLNTIKDKYNAQLDKVDKLTKEKEELYYFTDNEEKINEKTYWRKDVYESPYNLIFWFDFLDVDGQLNNYSVKSIGTRAKAINEKNIKSIYFRETPPVVFVPSGEDVNVNSGYKFIQVPNIESMFTISAQGKSAKESLDELLYKHSYCLETATITTIPIYYLQPNTRVLLYDKSVGLNGDYIVNKITLPLTYNGTMQLSVTKAAESIL